MLTMMKSSCALGRRYRHNIMRLGFSLEINPMCHSFLHLLRHHRLWYIGGSRAYRS